MNKVFNDPSIGNGQKDNWTSEKRIIKHQVIDNTVGTFTKEDIYVELIQ